MIRREGKEPSFSATKVLKNSTIYTTIGILQKAIGVFLLPVYTLYLTVEDYGISALINTFTAFVTIICMLALPGAVSRFYFEYKDNKKMLREFFGTIISTILIMTSITFILMCLFHKGITKYVIQGVPFYPLLLLGIITTVTLPVYNIYQSILQIEQKVKAYVINSMGYFVALLVGNILFIVVFRMGVKGMLLASALVSSFFGLYSIVALIRNQTIVFTMNLVMLKEALRYSLPLIPHNLSSAIANYVSKNMLSLASSISSVGLFSMASQLTSVLDIIQTSINSAFIPWFYHEMKQGKEEHRKIISLVDIIFTSICFISLGMAIFSKEMILILTSSKSYYEAWRIIPLLCLASLFQYIYIIYSNTLFYNKKATRFLWVISFMGCFVHILFSLVFTRKLDYFTPAFALVLQKVLMAGVAYGFSRKIEPVDFKLGNMLGKIALVTSGTVLALVLDWLDKGNDFRWEMFLVRVVVFGGMSCGFIGGYRKGIGA